MTHTTMIEAYRPAEKTHARLYDLAAVVGGSILLAVSARIMLPIGPIPFTMQTFVLILLGAVLGPKRGLAAVGLYLAQGLAGLPVFAFGAAGPAYLLGPTGGFLLGFIPTVGVTGLLARRGWDRRWLTAAAAMAIGVSTIFLPGVAWLAVAVGWEKAVLAGLLPFLPIEAGKVLIAATLLPLARKYLG